jgi:hypothetical protein
MFELQTAILLNRFHCAARLLELEGAEKREEEAAEDRARRDKKERDRREYVDSGAKRIQDWERRMGREI